MTRKVVFILTLLITHCSWAVVRFKTLTYRTSLQGNNEDFKPFVELLIKSGGINGRRIILSPTDLGNWNGQVPYYQVGNRKVLIEFHSSYWNYLTEGEKKQVYLNVGKSYGQYSAYHLSLHAAHNPLFKQERIFKVIGEHNFPMFLNSRVLKRLADVRANTLGEGVNCWFVSLAALAHDFGNFRFMEIKEFQEQLDRGFEKISSGEQLETGDLLRFVAMNNPKEDVHAAVFLGYDYEKEDRLLFLTKNGKSKGRILVMDLDTLSQIYPETKIEVWRAMGPFRLN